MLSTCWLLFLHSAVQLIPNNLHLVEVGGLWRPGHLDYIALFTLLLSRAMTSRAVLGWPGYIPTIVAGSLQDRSMWKENI